MANALQMAADKAFSKLPYGMQQIGEPEVLPADGRGSTKMRAGVEEGNPVSPMFVADQKNFEDPDYAPQLLRHEQTHRQTANWPEAIQKELPPINPQDPYNFGGVEGIEKVNSNPLKLSQEQMAAAEQTMQAMEQNGQPVPAAMRKLDQNFQAVPLSVMQPTDPHGEGINTMPRVPGLPAGYDPKGGTILQAQDKISVKPGSGSEAGPWSDYSEPAQESGPWDDYGGESQSAASSQPEDTRNSLQKAVDTAAEPDTPQMRAKQTPLENGLSAFGKGFTRTLIQPLAHPTSTLKGFAGMAADMGDANMGQYEPNNFVSKTINSEANKFHSEPLSQAIPDTLGEAAGMATSGKLAGEVTDGMSRIPEAGSAIRTAMIGDPDVAALRGLHVSSNSPKTLSTLRSVEGSRPYLQGAKSLSDLQARVPMAKQDIWQPYQMTIDSIGDHPVQGPDGMTTIRELENDRLQTSALLRDLKARSPEAIQVAQQKGLSQADLLERERAIKAALDPHLERAGINPQEIRSRFGNVAQVGSKISGKSTLAEPMQPYGFGKMLDMQIDNPRSWLGNPIQGARDIAAGRPLWRGSPTDVNLREAFRMAPEKPNLGAPYSPFSPSSRLLPTPESEFESIPLGDAPEPGEMPGSLMSAERFPAQNVGEARIIRNAKGQMLPKMARNIEFPDETGKLPFGRNLKGQIMSRVPKRQAWMSGSEEELPETPPISGAGVWLRKRP